MTDLVTQRARNRRRATRCTVGAMLPSSPARALFVPGDPLLDRLLLVAVVGLSAALTAIALFQPLAMVFFDNAQRRAVIQLGAGLELAALVGVVSTIWLRGRRIGRSLVLGPALGSAVFVLFAPRFLTWAIADIGACVPVPTQLLVDHPIPLAALTVVAAIAAFFSFDRPTPGRTVVAAMTAFAVAILVVVLSILPGYAFCGSIN